MVKDDRPARTYAQALFASTAEDWLGALKDVQARLEVIDGALDTLDDPDLSFARKEQMLRKVLPKGIPPGAGNFIRVLARDSRVASLPGIITELETLGQFGPGVQVIHVTSAVPLTKQEIPILKQRLSQRWTEQVDFRFHVDPSLLGGVIVRMGDQVIDGSVDGKLKSLHRRLRGQA